MCTKNSDMVCQFAKGYWDKQFSKKPNHCNHLLNSKLICGPERLLFFVHNLLPFHEKIFLDVGVCPSPRISAISPSMCRLNNKFSATAE